MSNESAAETLAIQIVQVIAQCIDELRAIFPTTIATNREEGPVKVFTQLTAKATDLLAQIDRLSHAVANTIHADHHDGFELSAAEHAVLLDDEDDERSQLVTRITLPLLAALGRCYSVLDRLPSPPLVGSGKPPPPPRGMLSLRNYTDIACWVELTVCWSILPLLEPNVLRSMPERMRYQLPKSLAGRIPRQSLSAFTTTTTRTTSTRKRAVELNATARIMGSLVWLDRFRPMLLPRHVTDLYASLLQAEQYDDSMFLTTSPIYARLLLPAADDTINDTTTTTTTPTLDPVLQAKAYQSLLLHGTRAPLWLRQRASQLLADLARRNLPCILQVFVHAAPAPHRSAAGLRLARALTTTTTTAAEHHSLVGHQVLAILQGVYQEYGSVHAMSLSESLSGPHETTVHAVWAILDVLPNRDAYLLDCIQQDLDDGQVHRVVQQLGTLLSSVPPSSNSSSAGWIRRLVLLPLGGLDGPGLPRTTLGMLLRLAACTTVLKSQLQDDTIAVLQLLRDSFVTSQCDDHAGTDVLAVALIYALAPGQWDLVPYQFQLCKDDSIRMVQKAFDGDALVDFVVEQIERRARGLVQHVFGPDDALASVLFGQLLQMYFSNDDEVDYMLSSPHLRLVPLVCVPVLCEQAPALSLLLSKEHERIFEIMQLVFRAAARQLGGNDVPNRGNLQAGTENLRAAAAFVSKLVVPDGLAPGTFLIDPAGTGSDPDVLWSIAAALLSILISILELGAPKRSQRDEGTFSSLIPLLEPLAELSDDQESTVPELAEMASHAVALLASRSGGMESAAAEDQPTTIPAEKLAQARKDLESKEPPIRARGVVSLRHVAANAAAENDGSSVDLEQLLAIAITALGDEESYVYLAAVHTIVSIVDAAPSTVLPILGRTLASGEHELLETRRRLTNDQRIKLAEALIFSIRRRRGAIFEYIPFLLECMLFGPRENRGHPSVELDDDNDFLIQQRTHDFFLHGHNPNEEDETLEKKKNWDEINLRVNTGGPLFMSEEHDAVRASQFQVVAELWAASDPPAAVAPWSNLVLDASMRALQLDTSRPVRRASAYLAKQFYAALVREGVEAADIPLAVSAVAGGEDKLCAVLERCCRASDLDDLRKGRTYDPATIARCQEALDMRRQAADSGLLAAGKAALEAQRQQANNPVARLLHAGRREESRVPRIKIEELN